MNKTIQIIAEICKEHRFREKLLFVPSYSLGHQIGEYLAKTGVSWINLRITTATGHAQGLLTMHLNQEGIRLIESQERLIIIETLYQEDDSLKGKSRYFKEAAEIPGILKCLANSVHEMRMAGLDHKSVDPGSFVVPEKGEELICLLESYDRFLKKNRLIDQPGLLNSAINSLKTEDNSEKDTIVMVISDFPIAPLEKELISLVGGEDLAIIDHTRPVAFGFPRRFLEHADQFVKEDSEPKADIDLLPWLFQPETAPGPFDDGSVSIFHALGESNEVREVFRRILKDGVPVDDVVILVTKHVPYVSLIYEIATALDLPITFSSGIPVTYTRPGRALIFYLQWQAEDLQASYLRRLFSGGYLDLDSFKLGGENPSFRRAAAIIRDASIGWGRARYPSRLKTLAESYLSKAREKREEGEEDKAQRAERAAEQVVWAERFVEEIMATLPDPTPEGTVTIKEACTGAMDFLKRFCRTADELDVAAKLRLLDSLETIAQASSLSIPIKEAAERLTSIIEGISVSHSNPKPGCIHVAHYRFGGYSGRSHTFALGLDQNSLPGMVLQDPVILDAERKRLGTGMVLSSDLLHDNAYMSAKVLGSLRGMVTLSYSCRDLREDRELFPSSILLGVYRVVTGDRAGDYRALKRFLGDPAGFVPKAEATPLNDWEWWLSQKGVRYRSDSVQTCYPDLLEGEKAERGRDLDGLGEYDGWIPSSAGALDPLTHKAVLSCSRLEDLARCPFAFFIRHVLGIEPLEVMEKDPSRWLDPLQRGELLHAVFRRFMEGLKAKGDSPTMETHLGFLEAIAQEEVEHWKAEIPPGSELAFDREVTEIKQALQIFLRDEVERCTRIKPCFFELSFGTGFDKKNGKSTDKPLEIELRGKRSFRLRGRIDRVDQCGDHEYEVWDYKTGSAWGYRDEGYVNRGRHLQHALYSVAAEILLRRILDEKAKVVRAGYFFTSPKGEGRRIGKGQLNREQLYEVLEDLSELLRSGVFPFSYDKEPCGICQYRVICGGPEVAVKQCMRKLSADKKLEPFKRLKEYA